MPTTYNIVPIPRWYVADLVGRPLGGGYMSTWRSLDKNTQKPIYTDASGLNAWPNPVFFNANGEAPGMFFWASDEPYFIKIFDAQNNLQFTADNYGPGIAGGGGGTPTNTNVDLNNYIVNNNFCRHGGDSALGDTFTNIQSGTVIAPSDHEGLAYGSTAFTGIPFVGPDIMFVKSNNTSTDNLIFATSDFNAGTVPLTGDVTPEYYIDLECTITGTETLKAVQFPVDLHVKNLEQQTMTLIVWANGITGTQNLTASFVQYFGGGSATTPVATTIPINATPLVNNTWRAYRGTFIVPSILGKTLGAGGDDASYIQIGYPIGAAFRIYMTKPKLYLGTIGSVFPELQTYDYVDSYANSPRTGDVRISLNTFGSGNNFRFGWVAANDGSIGSATSSATTRANIDTWPLYSLLWNNILDTWAPVATGRGISAIADFAANKAMTLTKTLARVLAGLNADTNTSQAFTTNYGVSNFNLTITSSAQYPTGTVVQLTGGGLPASLSAGVAYVVININATTIQLAESIENAYAGIPFNIGGNGAGTVQTALGLINGQTKAVLIANNIPALGGTGSGTVATSTVGGAPGVNSIATQLTAPTGTRPVTVTSLSVNSGTTNQPVNLFQPTSFMNIYIKL